MPLKNQLKIQLIVISKQLETLKNKGVFYTSRDYNLKIFDLIAEDDFNKIEELIEDGKANKYYAEDFTPKFKEDLKNDLEILIEIFVKCGNLLRIILNV